MWGLCGAPCPIIEVVRFRQDDFKHPSSEESILAFFATKRDCPDPLLFWIKTLEHIWAERMSYVRPADPHKSAASLYVKQHYQFLNAGLCEPLEKEEFVSLVQECSRELRKPLPHFLRDFNGYQSGLRMHADWNDVAAVAEFSDSYKAFFWETTA
jgi:hypothetical protein